MTKDRVLIAGAGPVGLAAAMDLAMQDIPVTVMEAEAALPENLRASTFHPPTLDMLAHLGATEKLMAEGLVAPKFQYRDRREGLIAEFDFTLLSDVTAYPFRVQCEQFKLNHILYEALRAFPHIEMLFASRVTAVEQDTESVTAVIESDGRVRRLPGRFLIGADGARSAVRDSLGIEFEGFTWPERFLVVSTAFAFERHFDDLTLVNYVADPEEWYFLLRVPGLWRVMFPTRPEESDESVLSDPEVERRLQRILPFRRRYETAHRTLYPVHQRVAASYRRGRAFLAGDAAHINNPLGGMGMNGGIHDALNLSEKIARVWHGGSEELDRYERQRRPIALDYVNVQSTRNKQNLETDDPAQQARFRRELAETAVDPVKAHEILLRVSMIASLRAAAALA